MHIEILNNCCWIIRLNIKLRLTLLIVSSFFESKQKHWDTYKHIMIYFSPFLFKFYYWKGLASQICARLLWSSRHSDLKNCFILQNFVPFVKYSYVTIKTNLLSSWSSIISMVPLFIICTHMRVVFKEFHECIICVTIHQSQSIRLHVPIVLSYIPEPN